MGIQGLLRNLAPLFVEPCFPSPDAPRPPPRGRRPAGPTHSVRQFEHKTLAVDASSWLHKAAFSTAHTLVEALEAGRRHPESERRYTAYVLKRCEEILTHARVKSIVLVFDGKRCPLKAGTNKEREEKRQRNLAEARRLRREGRTREADEKYRLCVKPNHEMARVVAGAVEKKWGTVGVWGQQPKVRILFAPYEADAQLAKCCVDGVADAVVTEDSDMLVYSAACGVPFPVIYKLDKNTGACEVLTMDWLLTGPNKRPEKPETNLHLEGLSSIRRSLLPPSSDDLELQVKDSRTGKNPALLSTLRAFSAREEREPGSGARLFVQACVLSGCDYAPSRLSGIGTVTAFKLMRESASRKPERRFVAVLKRLPRGKVLSIAEKENDSEISIKERCKSRVADVETCSGSSSKADQCNLSSTAAASSSLNRRQQDEKAIVAEYEEILAKSEAVFYYHLVRAKDGSIVPLVPVPDLTRKSADEKRESEKDEVASREDFCPYIDRFDGDLSFVGCEPEASSVDASGINAALSPIRLEEAPARQQQAAPNKGVLVERKPSGMVQQQNHFACHSSGGVKTFGRTDKPARRGGLFLSRRSSSCSMVNATTIVQARSNVVHYRQTALESLAQESFPNNNDYFSNLVKNVNENPHERDQSSGSDEVIGSDDGRSVKPNPFTKYGFGTLKNRTNILEENGAAGKTGSGWMGGARVSRVTRKSSETECGTDEEKPRIVATVQKLAPAGVSAGPFQVTNSRRSKFFMSPPTSDSPASEKGTPINKILFSGKDYEQQQKRASAPAAAALAMNSGTRNDNVPVAFFPQQQSKVPEALSVSKPQTLYRNTLYRKDSNGSEITPGPPFKSGGSHQITDTRKSSLEPEDIDPPSPIPTKKSDASVVDSDLKDCLLDDDRRQRSRSEEPRSSADGSFITPFQSGGAARASLARATSKAKENSRRGGTLMDGFAKQRKLAHQSSSLARSGRSGIMAHRSLKRSTSVQMTSTTNKKSKKGALNIQNFFRPLGLKKGGKR